MSKLIPEKWWTFEMPVISTAHVTKDDADKLNDPDLYCNPDSNKWVMDTPGGWVFYLPAVEPTLFSQAFYEMVRRLKENGYSFVRLDQDADKLEDLAAFDW